MISLFGLFSGYFVVLRESFACHFQRTILTITDHYHYRSVELTIALPISATINPKSVQFTSPQISTTLISKMIDLTTIEPPRGYFEIKGAVYNYIRTQRSRSRGKSLIQQHCYKLFIALYYQ